MKNKRQISKELTHKKIIRAAKVLIVKKGVINLPTSEIAKKAGVSHGSIFAHFSNRDTLILEVFRMELIRIAKELYRITDVNFDLRTILEIFFDYLHVEEDFFVVIAKEFPQFEKKLQRNIIVTESIIRKIFYNAIEKGISEGRYKKIDITMSISFLFATINYYLSRREFFITGKKGVLKAKKIQIINTFYSIINK